MTSIDEVEAVVTEIGFGRWQLLVLAFAMVFHGIIPVQQIGSTMLSAPVPFRCSYSDGLQHNNGTCSIDAITVSPKNKSEEFPSKCLQEATLPDTWMFQDKENISRIPINKHFTGLKSCPYIKYDTTTFKSTVITEWDLVCERAFLRPLFQMTYSIGAILGSLICGQLSDWLGRKRAIQTGCILATASVFLTSIVPWYSVMVIMRILTGTATILVLFPCYTLISEISSSNSRTISTILPGLMYFISMSCFSGVSYLVPNWRRLLLVCDSPLLLLVPVTFLIDESPRWLLQKGRNAEASDILKKASKKNRVTLSSTSISFLDNLSKMSKDVGMVNYGGGNNDTNTQGSLQMISACFSSPRMRRILIITPLIWFLKRALYIGIILNANNFTSANPFEYIIYSGIVGAVGILLSMPFSHLLQRRVYLGGGLCTGGALLLLELVVPPAYWLVKLIMVLASFSIVCGAFQVNYIYVAELFPTVIRNRGLTLSNFLGSIGEMTIPLVTDIAVLYQWWAPSVTFGMAGIVAGFLMYFLPETKDQPMPETLQDVEDRYWNKNKGHGKDETATKEENLSKTTFSISISIG